MSSEGVEVERRLCISGGSLGTTPWILKRMDVVDGVEFIPLVKADTAFSRFVTGKRRGLDDMGFLERLRELRTEATLKASQEGEGEGFMAAGMKAKKRQKSDARQKEQNGELVPVVTLNLPEFTNMDGRTIDQLQLKVIATLDTGRVLKVEATREALAYIREAMLDSKTTQPPQHQGIRGSVRWSKGRSCWVGLRKINGKTQHKGFKKTEEEDNDDEAFERAKNWAENADGDDDDDDEGDGTMDMTTEQMQGGSDA